MTIALLTPAACARCADITDAGAWSAAPGTRLLTSIMPLARQERAAVLLRDGQPGAKADSKTDLQSERGWCVFRVAASPFSSSRQSSDPSRGGGSLLVARGRSRCIADRDFAASWARCRNGDARRPTQDHFATTKNQGEVTQGLSLQVPWIAAARHSLPPA